MQKEAPGLHLISLPFSDDLRHPERLEANVISDCATPSRPQVECAMKVIDTLTLSSDFASTEVPNPHLQRHYEVIEVCTTHRSYHHSHVKFNRLCLSQLQSACPVSRQLLFRSISRSIHLLRMRPNQISAVCNHILHS